MHRWLESGGECCLLLSKLLASRLGLAFVGKVSSAYFLHPSVDSMERFYLHDEFVQGFFTDTFPNSLTYCIIPRDYR